MRACADLVMCICTHLPPPCSCAIYDGSLCSSVFGQANITVNVLNVSYTSAAIAAQDIFLNSTIAQFSALHDQDCINYGVLIGCMAVHLPCPGFAWCGPNSKDDLKSAVSRACVCNRPDSCIVNRNRVNTTVVDTLHSVIDMNLPNYFQGSSSTGPVGDSNAVCQDVTGKRASMCRYTITACTSCAGVCYVASSGETTEKSDVISLL